MRGFDNEDLDVLRRAVESNGRDIKQCCPGPPMDLIEDDEDSLLGPPTQAFPNDSERPNTPHMSNRARHSINRLERDRILFQRQKFGQVQSQASQQTGASPSPHQAPRRFSQRRRTSSHSRRHAPSSARTLDENSNLAEMPPLPSPSESDQEEGGINMETGARPSVSMRSQRRSFIPTADLEMLQGIAGERGLIPQIDRPMSMPYLCAKMWRWKELQVDAALHRLDPMPWCRFGRVTINNATVSCCNPYHYGLWIRPEHSLSSSAEGEDFAAADLLHATREFGVLANGGGPFGGHTSAREHRNDEAESIIAGHVRSSFKKTMEAMNVTRAAFAAALESSDEATDDDEDAPPPVPPPPPPLPLLSTMGRDEIITQPRDLSAQNDLVTSMANSIFPNHVPASPTIHTQAMAWGRMARWDKKERVGDVVALVGEFVAVGKLAGTVHDGQDVKLPWDVENSASFALIRQSEGETYEDIWLYNSGDYSLFISISKTLGSQRSDTIRRLSPGYCIRVHRSPIGIRAASEPLLGGFMGHGATSLNDPIAAAAMLNSVSFLTISVGVGWGPNYRRLHVTECPIRFEVIFT